MYPSSNYPKRYALRIFLAKLKARGLPMAITTVKRINFTLKQSQLCVLAQIRRQR